MCVFKNYIPDMKPVHNVSIYIDVAHIDDAVIFVLLLVYFVIPLDILIVASKQVK